MCEIKTYPAGSVFYTAIGCSNFGSPLQPFTNEYIKSVLTNNAQSKIDSNWANSLYLSIGNDTVSRGYIMPNEDPETKQLSQNTVFIFKLVLTQELRYIDCRIVDYKDGLVSNGKVVGRELFEHIIGDTINNDFMTKLGVKSLAFECYHDLDGNRELIVPSRLITDHFEVVSYQKFEVNAKGEITKEESIKNIDQK